MLTDAPLERGTTNVSLGNTIKCHGRAVATQEAGDDVWHMKTTKLFSLTLTALVALASTAWAGPHGGGSGGHFGGGFSGGHFGGGYSGGARVGSFNGRGIRAAPTLSASSASFTGHRSIGGLNRGPQQFY